jgi:hypothetical protein
MTHLPSLIKKIDVFCRLAEAMESLKRVAAPTTWTMPDDPDEMEEPEVGGGEAEGPGLYAKIMGTAKEFANADVADEIALIGELYKRAIEMNGGYNLVNRMLTTALSNMDSLIDEGTTSEDEVEAAEEILNEVSRDLRQRAKTSLSTQMDEPSAMKQLKAVRDAFNQRAIHEELESQPQVYEKGREESQTGHNIAPKLSPETPQKYDLEMERLAGLLNDPSLAGDAGVQNTIRSLLLVLDGLKKKIPQLVAARDALKVTPNDPDALSQLDEINQSVETDRAERIKLKRKINSLLQNKELSELLEKYNSSSNPAEKKWLLEQMELQKTRLSNDYNKRNEIKHRMDLIRSLGMLDERGNFQSLKPSTELEARLRQAISSAQNERKSKLDYDAMDTMERAILHGKPGFEEEKIELDTLRKAKDEKKISKQEYDAKRWQVLARARGKSGTIVSREKGRRGGGTKGAKINQFSAELATFDGLVQKFSDKVNTAVNTARQGVTQEAGQGGKVHNALKPYVDNLGKAIQKNDVKAKYEAIRALKSAIVDWSSREPALRILEKSTRMLGVFNKLKDELRKVSGWRTDAGWSLTEDQKAYISGVIGQSKRFSKIYGRFYTRPGQPELFYDKALQQLATVLSRLEEETGVTGVSNDQ